METAAGAKESVESTVSESLHSKFVFITVMIYSMEFKWFGCLGLSETAAHAQEYVMDTLSGGKQGNFEIFVFQVKFIFIHVL